jgi:hypothetical protein
MSSAARPFRVLGIQQIAIGGLDKSALTKFWVNTMGIEKVGEYKAEVRLFFEDVFPLLRKIFNVIGLVINRKKMLMRTF